jgi:hypothetical protein
MFDSVSYFAPTELCCFPDFQTINISLLRSVSKPKLHFLAQGFGFPSHAQPKEEDVQSKTKQSREETAVLHTDKDPNHLDVAFAGFVHATHENRNAQEQDRRDEDRRPEHHPSCIHQTWGRRCAGKFRPETHAHGSLERDQPLAPVLQQFQRVNGAL